MATIDALLRELVERASTPPERATGLPPALYRSAELFELERERIFATDWLCPGRSADVPKPGDYLTFSINDQPLFVVRGADGAIRAFSNVCLHRMTRLLVGSGNCRHIACPYHGWTYDLSGRLVGAPHMNRTPAFDTGAMRLPAIRTELWEGWIYVTLNPDAVSIGRQLAPLGEVVGRYAMADYVPLAVQDYVWNTNWKTLVENGFEGYHLPVAHRKTVGTGFPMTDTEFPAHSHDAFSFQVFSKDETSRYGIAHPSNKRLEGRWRSTSVLPFVYPAHMYVLAPDLMWYLSIRPKALGQVHVRLGITAAPEVMASVGDRDAFARERLAFFDEVCAEDRAIVEGIYENLSAPLARPGRMSWLERGLHEFFGYLARRLAGWSGEAARGPTLRVAS